jgi:predicted ATPase/DNA-binding SARP family transcriptional activator
MMETPAHRLALRLLGYPEAEMDGLPIRLARRKALALLAYLGLSPTGAGRDVLAALLWPGYDQEQATTYLRQALWELNKALGKGVLSAEGQIVLLAPEVDLWVDVLRFEEALSRWKAQRAEGSSQALRSLEEAAALYRGDFLAGFTLRDSSTFDDWQLSQSEALRRRLGEALASLADGYTAQGDLDMAIASVQRWLAIDPLDEAGHRELMRLYAWAGQRSAALRQYETCTSQLDKELGAVPEAATMELYEQIRSGAIRPRGKPAVLASPLPGGPAISRRPETRSIVPPTPFVGRETELAQLGRILSDPECRLLTLMGPGGIGKTRLAMQFADTQMAAYAHGVVLVPLATRSSGEQLVGAIAEALHLSFRQQPDVRFVLEQEQAQLSDYLRNRAILLVLDNMEHLTGAAVLLSDILAEAPGVKLLVTSRERLALPEEWVMEVQGLSSYSVSCPGERGAASSAAQLFVKCAQRARADLPWEDADWPAIAHICQLVEGAPLAIELAAAWVGVLSCREIAAELERDLDLLVSRRRGTPERHASLRAAFEHSWRLLSEAERSAFSQLSVFQGGFMRSAAAQVARASLEMLSALADKSLLRRDAKGRYSIHHVLRQYAAEALERTPPARAGTLDRHRAYYLDLLETMGQRLMGPGQQEALEYLKVEAGNLRLALQTAVEGHDWERLRQVLAFWILFLEMRGSRGEAWEALQPVLVAAREAWANQQGNVAINTVLALALAAQHYFAFQVDAPPVEEALRESLALARALPDSLEKAFALLLNCNGPGLPSAESQALSRQCLAIFQSLNYRWGQAMAQLLWADATGFGCGAYAEAEPVYQASRTIFEMLGDRWGQALCLTGLAYVSFKRQDYERAISLAQASLAIYRELGDPQRMASLRSYLAQYAAAMGDYGSAERYHRENLAAALQYGQRGVAALFLAHLGHFARLRGDLPASRAYYEQSLDLFRQVGDTQGAAWVSRTLETLA